MQNAIRSQYFLHIFKFDLHLNLKKKQKDIEFFNYFKSFFVGIDPWIVNYFFGGILIVIFLLILKVKLFVCVWVCVCVCVSVVLSSPRLDLYIDLWSCLGEGILWEWGYLVDERGGWGVAILFTREKAQPGPY